MYTYIFSSRFKNILHFVWTPWFCFHGIAWVYNYFLTSPVEMKPRVNQTWLTLAIRMPECTLTFAKICFWIISSLNDFPGLFWTGVVHVMISPGCRNHFFLFNLSTLTSWFHLVLKTGRAWSLLYAVKMINMSSPGLMFSTHLFYFSEWIDCKLFQPVRWNQRCVIFKFAFITFNRGTSIITGHIYIRFFLNYLLHTRHLRSIGNGPLS